MGLHYKIVEGIFTFDPGVYLHNYRIKDEQLNTIEKKSEILDLMIIIRFFNDTLKNDVAKIIRQFIRRNIVLENH